MGSYVFGPDGQIQRIPLRIASLFSIFARFSLYNNALRLFPFPNLKKWSEERDSSPESSSSSNRNTCFERLDKSYYSDSLKKLENQSLNQESSWEKIMLRNKNESIKKKCILLCFSKNLMTYSRICSMFIHTYIKIFTFHVSALEKSYIIDTLI